jgi:hypothetical protein
MAEAEETGFEGMYQLLTQYKLSKETHTHTALLLDRTASTLQIKGPHIPLIWSLDSETFLELQDGHLHVAAGDYLFLFNQGLLRFYQGQKRVSEQLAKVLKVFASDGLETTTAMLQKELAFATKRKALEEDIHLLCLQLLTP